MLFPLFVPSRSWIHFKRRKEEMAAWGGGELFLHFEDTHRHGKVKITRLSGLLEVLVQIWGFLITWLWPVTFRGHKLSYLMFWVTVRKGSGTCVLGRRNGNNWSKAGRLKVIAPTKHKVFEKYEATEAGGHKRTTRSRHLENVGFGCSKEELCVNQDKQQ